MKDEYAFKRSIPHHHTRVVHNETQIPPWAFVTSPPSDSLDTTTFVKTKQTFWSKTNARPHSKRANTTLWWLLESIVCWSTVRHAWLVLFSQVLLVLAMVKRTFTVNELSFGFNTGVSKLSGRVHIFE